MIREVNHITLAVKDVEISFAFYKKVLRFTPILLEAVRLLKKKSKKF